MAKITVEVIDKMGTEVVLINAGAYGQDVMLTGVVEKAVVETKPYQRPNDACRGACRIFSVIGVIRH